MENLKLKFKRNARDFSYITTLDGKKIKPKKIIRSAHLSKLSKKEINLLLKEYNLKMVIDLRADSERKEKKETVIEGVKYLHIPFFNESTLGITSGMGTDVLSAVKNTKNAQELYDYIPELDFVYPLMANNDFSTSQISKCIKEIINNRDGAALFHCTAGKDRTGVASAIILKILNVSDEDIYKDYTYTNVVSSKSSKKYSKLAMIFFRNKKLSDKIERVFLAEESSLKSFFDEVYKCYGTFDNYIYNVLKIDNKEIESFKEYIL